MGWVYYTLGSLDGLGLLHIGFIRWAGSTTRWVHETGWVYYMLGSLDGLGLLHVGFIRTASFKLN